MVAQAGGEGPSIDKVVLPEPLFNMAVERGRETTAEVGFFTIGLVRKRTAFIYDLVEFDYDEKSPVLIRSGVERKLRLVGALPLGLRLIGNMHKHPGTPSPSLIDEEMFLKYARGGGLHAFIIYTVEPAEARAFTVEGEHVVEVNCEIRELREEEKLFSIRLKLPLDIRVCFPRNTSLFELKLLLANALCLELRRQVGLPRIYVGEREASDMAELVEASLADVRPYSPVDVEASWSSGLFYRFYIDELEEGELRESIKKALGDDVNILEEAFHEGVKLLRVQRRGIAGGEGVLEGLADEGGDKRTRP